MGLNISAFEIVDPEVCGPPEVSDAYDWDQTVLVYNIPAFKERQDELKDGRHRCEGRFLEFHAGSYSTYEEFRENLAQMLGYAGCEEIWERLLAGDKGLDEAPFIKLLNYADKEGVLGPKTCASLARDFRDFLPLAEQKLDAANLDTYQHFLVAFELAACHGCVAFR